MCHQRGRTVNKEWQTRIPAQHSTAAPQGLSHCTSYKNHLEKRVFHPVSKFRVFWRPSLFQVLLAVVAWWGQDLEEGREPRVKPRKGGFQSTGGKCSSHCTVQLLHKHFQSVLPFLQLIWQSETASSNQDHLALELCSNSSHSLPKTSLSSSFSSASGSQPMKRG